MLSVGETYEELNYFKEYSRTARIKEYSEIVYREVDNHSRYGHFIYTRSEGNDTLYVNLFTPSRLESDKFQVTQENSYPEQPSTRITICRFPVTFFMGTLNVFHLSHPPVFSVVISASTESG